MKYPCKDCILLGNCSKICDKVLDDNIHEYMSMYRCCPDCGHKKITIEGNKSFKGSSFMRRAFSCYNCRSRFWIGHPGNYVRRSSGEGKGYIFVFEKYVTIYELMTFLRGTENEIAL